MELNHAAGNLGARCGRDSGVQAIRGSLIETFEEVPVRVERGRNRRMTEADLNGLWMLALGNKHGDMGVAQVVEPDGLTDRLCYSRQPHPPPKIRAAQRATTRCLEDKPIISDRDSG